MSRRRSCWSRSGTEIIQGPQPKTCPYRHPLGQNQILVGWSPCVCPEASAAHGGHGTVQCLACLDYKIKNVCYEPLHLPADGTRARHPLTIHGGPGRHGRSRNATISAVRRRLLHFDQISQADPVSGQQTLKLGGAAGVAEQAAVDADAPGLTPIQDDLLDVPLRPALNGPAGPHYGGPTHGSAQVAPTISKEPMSTVSVRRTPASSIASLN